jgi:hypothetical protein
MYAKIFASLYQGTLRGRPHEILVFTNLLAHADAAGYVDKHFRAVAEETGLTEEEVRAAILILEAPDPESRSPECAGARLLRMDEHRAWGWKIVNHGKYRAIKNEDDRREQNKLAQARWREKNKPSSSKQPSAGVSDSKQPSAGVSEVSPSRGRGRGRSRGSKQMQQAEAEGGGSAPALPTQKQLCPKVERKLLGEDWLQNGMATESTSPLPYDVIAAKVCSFFNRPAGAPLSYIEQSAISGISQRESALFELKEITAWREKEKAFFYQSMSKLLSNWDEALDKARTFEERQKHENNRSTAPDRNAGTYNAGPLSAAAKAKVR